MGFYFDADIASAPSLLVSLSGSKTTPQLVSVIHRLGEQVIPVDGNTGPFHIIGGNHTPPFSPPPESQLPQKQGLQSRSLPGVIGADKYDHVIEIDGDLFELLEISDSYAG